MPGGGFGIFNGCTTEWGTPSTGWGAQYGGISTRSQCDAFPAKLRSGCYWRFDWFQNADNPTVTWQKVTCPAALTAKSGCVQSGETPTGSTSVPTYSAGTGSASSSSSSTKATTVATSSTKTISAGSSTTSVSGGSAGSVAHWGQCGGTGYSGPTTCAAPYTCVLSNQWYSQCL